MNKREFLKGYLVLPGGATRGLQMLAAKAEGEEDRPKPRRPRRAEALVRDGRLSRQVHRLQPLHGGVQDREQRPAGAVLLPHVGRALPITEQRRRRRSSASARTRAKAPSRGSGRPEVLRTFFVPKLCNQCANPPCVQVCPVGATFQTKDGVVLVDEKRCIGCRYCIQACPYGARYLNP